MALVKTSIQPTVVNITKYSPSGNILYFSHMHRQSKSYSLQDVNKINGTSGKDARTYGIHKSNENRNNFYFLSKELDFFPFKNVFN